MNAADIVGFIAGTLTTASSLPQVLKTYRMKSAETLSYRMVLLLSAGVAVWIAYGVMTRSLPIIITNGISLLLAVSLVVMKRRYDKPGQPAQQPASDYN
jgi:MtN3 and saliva related transmembrane protein